MDVIEKYQPLNTQEAIDSLMVELKKTPGVMRKSVYMQIFQSIRKVKLQIYFQETYPEKSFNCPEITVHKPVAEVNHPAYKVYATHSRHKKKVVKQTDTEKKIVCIKTEQDVDDYISSHPKWRNFKNLYRFTLKANEIKDNVKLEKYFKKKISALRNSIIERNIKRYMSAPEPKPVLTPKGKGNQWIKIIPTPMGGQDRRRRH